MARHTGITPGKRHKLCTQQKPMYPNVPRIMTTVKRTYFLFPFEDRAGGGTCGHVSVLCKVAAGEARRGTLPLGATGSELLVGEANGEPAGGDIDVDHVALPDQA